MIWKRKKVFRVASAAAAATAVLGATTATALIHRGPDVVKHPRRGHVLPIQYSKIVHKGDRRHIETTSSPSSLLQAILARLGSSSVVSATIAGPPTGYIPTEDPSSPPPPAFATGKWAYFTVTTPDDAQGSIRPVWEAQLVAGALRDEMHAHGLVSLYSDQVDVKLPDGSVVTGEHGGLGNTVFGQVFSTTTPASIAADIAQRVANAGLTLVSVRVLTPEQSAPMVVVRSNDPAGFVKNEYTMLRQIFGNPTTYEGIYLEAQDSAGSPFFIVASSFRTATGQTWYRPDLDPQRLGSLPG